MTKITTAKDIRRLKFRLHRDERRVKGVGASERDELVGKIQQLKAEIRRREKVRSQCLHCAIVRT